jgi:pyruvate carboxylase
MLAQDRLLLTDTTMRDAHQSLLATRMRSYDIVRVADAYAHNLPQLFSLECWGGATFDVAMRFLNECPWERLRQIRARVPNILLQMLLRGANGVGYTTYPDNVVRTFVKRAASSGVDLFRVFDSLNWVENMRVAMDAVLESGRLLEGAIFYTGDLHDPDRDKYDLKYYVSMARELAAAGSHIIGIKDMAGLAKPDAITTLVRVLKEETGLPVHFHTHDTSGIAAASVLAAAKAGVDAVDLAMDSLSGLTSQPNLGSIAGVLRGGARDTGLDAGQIRAFSDYWEGVRAQYAAFESDLRFGASEVYLHEMPGGQFTNLKEQARALGLEERWHEVARAYAEVNRMLGDIVKVTPSSKMVGDMALMMVSADLSRVEVEHPDKEIAFPESVRAFFRGELGQPPGGFPPALQKKVLGGETAITNRPGANLPAADLDALRERAEKAVARRITDEEFNSYLMYPDVFTAYAAHRREFGPVDVLPTKTFFYGMRPDEEITVDLEAGKSLVIRRQAVGEIDDEGFVKFFFELNGQPRTVRIANRQAAANVVRHPQADGNNPSHVAAPMPGVIGAIAVSQGQMVESGDLLMSIEAMKMETAIRAARPGTILAIAVKSGMSVDAKDLLLEYEAEE